MGLLDFIAAPRSREASGLFGHLLTDDERQDDAANLGDRITASLSSFAGSHALLPAILNGIQAFSSGHRTDPAARAAESQDQRHAMLVSRGFDPQLATSIAADPELTRRIVMHLVTKRDANSPEASS